MAKRSDRRGIEESRVLSASLHEFC